eukprot:scaffold16033_cov118-Phaeocystis_antarctica.AAC.1
MRLATYSPPPNPPPPILAELTWVERHGSRLLVSLLALCYAMSCDRCCAMCCRGYCGAVLLRAFLEKKGNWRQLRS